MNANHGGGVDENHQITPALHRKLGLFGKLIVGGVILLLAAGGVEAYVAYVHVTKSDYKQAASVAADAKTRLSTLDSVIVHYADVVTDESVPAAAVEAAKADYEKAMDEYRAKAGALKAMRAMRDGEAARRHDTFETKHADYVEYNATLVSAMSAIHTMTVRCGSAAANKLDSSNLDQIAVQWDAAYRDCDTAVAALAKSPNADAAKTGRVAQAVYSELHTVIREAQAAYIAKDRVALTRASNRLNALSQSMDIKNVTDGIKQREKSLTPVGRLDDVRTYLESKA